MTIKQQFDVLKRNWLVVVLALVALLIANGVFSSVITPLTTKAGYGGFGVDAGYAEEYGRVASNDIAMTYPGYGGEVAPEITERKIVRSSSLTTEIERGEFETAHLRVIGSVAQHEGLILNQYANTYDQENVEYKVGSYTIRVPLGKYDAILAELKTLGEVTQFNENADDITGQYASVEEQLAAEYARLARYEAILAQTQSAEEKLYLTDRIFDLERTISYLQDSLNNQDEQIEYASVYLTLQEEQSEYASIALTNLSELVRSFVNSVNSVLHFIFIIIPYAIGIWIIWFIVKKVRK